MKQEAKVYNLSIGLEQSSKPHGMQPEYLRKIYNRYYVIEEPQENLLQEEYTVVKLYSERAEVLTVMFGK